MQTSLAKWWNTHNKEDLLKNLAWIEAGGHRKGFDEMATDLAAIPPPQLTQIRRQIANNPAVSNTA